MSQAGDYFDGIETLTGNAGGAVGPDNVGNINTLGGVGLTNTGDPATHTLTMEVDAQQGIIYISKHGNDANSGLNIENAKLTIQAGVTAATAGQTVMVSPGTYTEAITHANNNVTVIARGKPNECIITQANANVVDFNSRTNIQYQNFTIQCTAATTAINTVQGSTGNCTFKDCKLRMVSATAIVAASQPAIGEITGAGTLNVVRGEHDYFHTGACGATALKGAFKVGTGGTIHINKVEELTVTNSGTALATAVGIDQATTGVFELHNNKITVTDPNSTDVIGLGYIGGTGTTHEFYENTIHVIAGAANTGYGFFAADTASTSRFFYNHIHVTDTGGTSCSYYVGNTATVISQLDDIIAADGVNIVGTGVFTEASSNQDGMIDLAAVGTAKDVTDFLTIANLYQAADMDGTGTGILFNQKYYNVATPVVVDAGRIAVITETDWDSTAANQDSKMSFQTCLDGTVSEKVVINSKGYVGLSQPNPEWLLDLLQNGVDSYSLMAFDNADSTAEIRMGAAGSAVANVPLRNNAFILNSGASSLLFGTSDQAKIALNDSGYVGIKSMGIVGTVFVPSSPLDIEHAGIVTANKDFLEITNISNAAAMTGTSSGILFNQWAYDAATPALADAGRIAVITEGNWTTASAATQDSYMSFQTALDGTVAEKMSLSSKGVTKIGTGTIDATAAAVHTIFNGTAPSGAVTDGVEIYAVDTSDSTSTLALYTEQAVEAGAITPSHKLKVLINGVEYWISLDAV